MRVRIETMYLLMVKYRLIKGYWYIKYDNIYFILNDLLHVSYLGGKGGKSLKKSLSLLNI